MLSKYSIEKNFERFLYLSRLEYGAGNYFHSIDTSFKLYELDVRLYEKYPEQIVALMPIVYLKQYEAASTSTGIPIVQLLSISRQESSFRAKIHSQLMRLG